MPDARDMPVGELALMLADDIERVVEALNLDVRRRTPRKLICMSPFAPDRPKLEVETAPIRGKWNDWSAGRFGDALGLVVFALGHEDPKSKEGLREAIRWAKQYFGLAAGGFDQDDWIRRREAAAKRAEEGRKKAQRELAQQRKTAFGLWLGAAPIQPGDVGWKYLEARGIELMRLGRRPGFLRVSERQDWFDEDGEVRHVGPALMSAMNLSPYGGFGSLHRTWLDPDRPGEKADLSYISDSAQKGVRKMWPSSEGSAINIWRGESRMNDREATAKGRIEDMIVGEGVEDGLSAALMAPELRVKAAGSLPGLLSLVPPKHVRTMILLKDNDWGKPQAAALFQRACVRFATEFGKAVRVASSPEGKDFNDLLRERT